MASMRYFSIGDALHLFSDNVAPHFTLANGHRCIGQVLEYISGMEPNTLCKSFTAGVDERKISAFVSHTCTRLTLV